MKNELRVVVTGYGAVTPLGETAGTTWDGIVNHRRGYDVVASVETEDSRLKSRVFGILPENAGRYRRFRKSLIRTQPDFSRNALVAADEALDRAFPEGGDWRSAYDSFDVGVIIGTGWGGLDSANRNNNDYRASGMASTYATLMAMNNAATAAVSQNFGLRGPQSTPVAACASGAIAIGEAYQAIRSGRARMMLAGGSETLREIFNLYCIDILDALSKERADPSRASCPFCKRRSGFVLSEGAAVLCLENLADARRRGATILGEITGYGNFSDAHDLTVPAPDGLARVRAIGFALAEAGLQPADIDYINAHGTGTQLNDLNESDAIKNAFGGRAYRVPISSTKGNTGHLIGAAGALESIVCLKSIATGLIPATVNLDEPDPACDLDYTPNQNRDDVRVRRTLNLSFGFGGANAALVIEEVR
jgi:3-oxoacyl-[acyl-carrier-protein] synthase II